MSTNLNRLANLLKRKGLITQNSWRILYEVAQSIRAGSEENWELIITPDNPLQFIKAELDDRVKPDIFCEITASGNEDYPLTHLRLVLRAWSIQENLSYRPEWDSEKIMERLKEYYTIDRVISRCHYDNCSVDQYAPYYHFQFHGTPHVDELYWFPHNVELPHFPSPPIDLILACEVVVATFFPTIYYELLQKGEWRKLIKESEEFILKKYYERCKNYLDSSPPDQTLLDSLCNQPS